MVQAAGRTQRREVARSQKAGHSQARTAQPDQARCSRTRQRRATPRVKEIWLVRLATLITASGPRLHVRAHGGGYVDIGEATGEARFPAFGSFVEAGPAALEAPPGLQDPAGPASPPPPFAPALPPPPPSPSP